MATDPFKGVDPKKNKSYYDWLKQKQQQAKKNNKKKVDIWNS